MSLARNLCYLLMVMMAALLPGAARASNVVHTTGTVNGNMCDIWTWPDGTGHLRTVALKMEGNGNSGHGGYAIQMTYYRNYEPAAATGGTPVPNWVKVTANADANDDGGGFGYFVSHERSRNFTDGDSETIASKIFGQDDSPLGNGFAATSAIPLNTATAGAQSFTINYYHYGTVTPGGIDPNTWKDSPLLGTDASLYALYTIPVTTTWVFQQGRDFPRIDVSMDLSQVIPAGSNTPAAGLVSFDVRGPYGVMVFDNGADATVDFAQWGDQAYSFVPLLGNAVPITLESPWTWNTPNKGARYTALTALSANGRYEMGLYEPLTVSASALVDGYAAERSLTSTTYTSGSDSNCSDDNGKTLPQMLPSVWAWPYQSVQYSIPCSPGNYLTNTATSKKIAWGSTAYYGSTLTQVNNGVSNYPINAFPANYKLNYSVCVVLNWDNWTAKSGPLPTAETTRDAATKYTPAPAKPRCATAAP